MHKLRIEVIKFLIIGAANFFLTLIIFTLMLKVFKIHYLLSLGTAWFIGVVFSYILNFSWTFRPESQVQFKERFLKFLIANTISITLNMAALKYLVERTDIDPFYLQLALIPLIVIFNFCTAKLWSLRASS